MVTSEEELSHAIRKLGEDAQENLWPDRTIDDAGFNLLLVHLQEVLVTRNVTEPLRITREGLVWPEPKRRG